MRLGKAKLPSQIVNALRLKQLETKAGPTKASGTRLEPGGICQAI